MTKWQVKVLEDTARSLYKTSGNYSEVARQLELNLSDVLFLLKFDENSRYKHFKNKPYENLF